MRDSNQVGPSGAGQGAVLDTVWAVPWWLLVPVLRCSQGVVVCAGQGVLIRVLVRVLFDVFKMRCQLQVVLLWRCRQGAVVALGQGAVWVPVKLRGQQANPGCPGSEIGECLTIGT